MSNMYTIRYPLFVAELSGNHNKNLDIAIQLVRAAADAGAYAVKLQTYTPDCITMDSSRPEFIITDQKSLWYGKTLYQLYTEAAMPWEFHAPIFEEAKACGIKCFSTPFSERAVDFLETLDNPIYKIASFEVNHIPLLRRINKTKKPVIISTGVATVFDLVDVIYNLNDCPEITMLKCTSEYPAKERDANLREMPTYAERYGCYYGLSDHTTSNYVAMAATVLGASIIEKHIKLDTDSGGVDAGFSITPDAFKHMINECKMIASTVAPPLDVKKAGSRYRRSLYIIKDIKKGEIFTDEHIRVIRPNLGCAPMSYDLFIGRPAKDDYFAGTPTHYGMVD